jgi:hypothetical protein
LPASLMYFCSRKSMHFSSGVDRGGSKTIRPTAASLLGEQDAL